MNVTVNAKATQWVAAQSLETRTAYNTKCQEAVNDDLSTWRNVGAGLFDYRVSGNFRMLAKKSGGKVAKPADNFEVLAIYRHATGGGKEWVAGEKVPAYS